MVSGNKGDEEEYMGVKVMLGEDELPKYYYNIRPDLPGNFAPPLDPRDNSPAPQQAFEMFFTKEGSRQEFSSEPKIAIPEEVREAYYRFGRPTPLYRAKRLEAYLKTPAKIYFKREDLNPCGSHKPNTAIPQAYYGMKEGLEAFTTETGAGQWGTALSYATMLFGMKCIVFMVKSSFDQKPYRKVMMNMFGAEVHASPSTKTEFGRALLAKDPDNGGTLGVAISEAIETRMKMDKTRYSLGSVLNHVLLHQTVIGQETIAQFEKIGETPDQLIACVGGGSNFAGFTFPFIGQKLKGKAYKDTEFIAVEPEVVPSLTKGEFRYDFGDTAGTTPLLKMHTLGKDNMVPSIYAGGLRYHGMAPLVSHLASENVIRALAVGERSVFEAAKIFSQTEGIIPAPESSHAIRVAIDEALKCRKTGESKVIAFNLSGHGLLDLGGYEDFMDGKLGRAQAVMAVKR
ncbi:Tryptophan synthase beta chain 2 [uncultured archaeon]|nr:Tryptophan synthase beta chain 2 [uncultured archaeon]